jgi:hypothetical protein
MPINDLKISECLTLISTAQRAASEAVNRGVNEDAFKAFMAIERYAMRAQQRLNELKYRSA